MANKYIIKNETIFIESIGNNTKIIENKKEIIINNKINNIIDESCKYYCSSLTGRISSSSYLLGIYYKCPIIISEQLEIIMFPTSSIRDSMCKWINYNHIDKYYKDKNNTVIEFKNGKKIALNTSIRIINNQILKSSRLESILKSKKQ